MPTSPKTLSHVSDRLFFVSSGRKGMIAGFVTSRKTRSMIAHLSIVSGLVGLGNFELIITPSRNIKYIVILSSKRTV